MLTLPLPAPSPRFSVQVELPDEATPLRLSFDWNTRAETWTLTITTLEGIVLLTGQAIKPGIPLLEGKGILAGDLLVYDSIGDSELTYDSLGVRHQLVYLTPSELT